MNNKLISTICIIIVSIFLTGCSGGNNKVTENKVNENKAKESNMIENYEKISKAIESGKPMKCKIVYSGEETGVPANMMYWVKGEDMRIEMKMGEIEQVVIQKKDTTYMSPQSMYGADSDCDWISMKEEYDNEDEDEEDMSLDYEEFDEDPLYTIKCTPESFGSDKLKVSGKICSMEDIMSAMMGGINFDDIDM